MNKEFGCQNMSGRIRRVLIKRPECAYINQSNIDQQSDKLNYYGKPVFEQAVKDYENFYNILKSFDIDIHELPSNNTTTLDSIYTHDPCIVSNSGVILCLMGKELRKPEPEEISSYFTSIGIPIAGKITAPGKVEGGDVVWINEKTLAVGVGYRTNMEGIRQLGKILEDDVDEIIPVHLPHWTGSSDCLHLMSNVSPIDENLYVVYSRLLPVEFREYLLNRKIELIEVPDEEYGSMGCNVLAIAPKEVLMLRGNPVTENRLIDAGVIVHLYDGSEISIKGAGGSTCLTRPFLRD